MRSNSAAIILRWGLAFVFFYAAVASLRHPETWIGYLPSFLANLPSANIILVGFSVIEIVLAIWLFWGKKLAWSSIIAALMLAGITIVNLQTLDITFRDIGLAMAALALFELSREKNFKEDQ
jgi:uncharacterized membrane protein YphA (DoxX/SURF4 family)